MTYNDYDRHVRELTARVAKLEALAFGSAVRVNVLERDLAAERRRVYARCAEIAWDVFRHSGPTCDVIAAIEAEAGKEE